MARYPMVVVREYATGGEPVTMRFYDAVTGIPVDAISITTPAVTYPVGRTYSARNLRERKKLLASGNWQDA